MTAKLGTVATTSRIIPEKYKKKTIKKSAKKMKVGQVFIKATGGVVYGKKVTLRRTKIGSPAS